MLAGDDDDPVITDADLLAAVDVEFDATGRDLDRWADPHRERAPHDDEYSRVTDPGRWRIVGARADAWLNALAQRDLAAVERDVNVQWRSPPTPVISRTARTVPRVAGALPLVVARSRIDDTDDAGVTLGVGEPAVWVMSFPYCGCDACDTGAAHELDQIDEYILSIVTGRFRRLSRGDQQITVLDGASWSGTDLSPRGARDVLADPTGWDEISGISWLAEE